MTLTRDSAQRLAALAPAELRGAAQRLLDSPAIAAQLHEAEAETHARRLQLRAELDALTDTHLPALRQAIATCTEAERARAESKRIHEAAVEAHARAFAASYAAGRTMEVEGGRLERGLRDTADRRLLELGDWIGTTYLLLRHEADAGRGPKPKAAARLRELQDELRAAELKAEDFEACTTRLRAACAELAGLLRILAGRFAGPSIDAAGRLVFTTEAAPAAPAPGPLAAKAAAPTIPAAPASPPTTGPRAGRPGLQAVRDAIAGLMAPAVR